MGWTIYNFHNSPRDIHAERREIINLHRLSPDAPYTLEVIHAAKVGSVWYCACKTNRDQGDRVLYETDETGAYVFCSVFLTSRQSGEWGYKDIDETMGPGESKCPPVILNMLSPLTDHPHNEYAKAFRERCRDHADRPKIEEGDKVTLPVAVRFAGGHEAQVFRKVSLGRKRGVFRALDNPALGLVRLMGDNLQGATIEKGRK